MTWLLLSRLVCWLLAKTLVGEVDRPLTPMTPTIVRGAVPELRQRGHGASPGLALSRQRSQLSTSQIAESLAGGELPLTVSGESDAKDPRELARDSSEGVGDAIFSQPAFL